MKSLTDLQWYDQNGNLVKSYDANAAEDNQRLPAILYFPAPEAGETATSQPQLLKLPDDYDNTKTYVLKMAYTAQDGWRLSWVAES